MSRPDIPTYCYFQGCYNPEYEADKYTYPMHDRLKL